MPLVIPGSTVTTAGLDHAAETTSLNNSILVRDGIYLSASGFGAKAVNMAFTGGTATIDGYLFSEAGDAFHLSGFSTGLIGEEGVVTSEGTSTAGVFSDGNSVLTNNGAISSRYIGVTATAGDFSFVNNGSVQSFGGIAVELAGSSTFINNGSVVTRGFDAVQIQYGGTGNAHTTVTNNGSISAASDGIQILQGDANRITNTGTIEARVYGIIGANSANHVIVNSGTITSDGDAVNLAGGAHQITNSGSIASLDTGIDLNAVITYGGNTVTNTATGTITGETMGVRILSAGSVVTNDGVIAGGAGIVATNSTTTNTANGNHTILNSGTVSALSGGGIDLTGTSNRVTNSGTINAEWDAIELNVLGTITNTATGTLTAHAFDGISAVQGNAVGRTVIENAGTIQSEGSRGIVLNAANAVVRNSGTITSNDTGIYALNDGNRIVNSGAITTGDEGIWANFSGTTIVNSGSVIVDEQAIRVSSGGTGEALVRNSGDVTADTYYTVALLTGSNAADFFNSGTVTSADGGAVFLNGTGGNLLRNTGDIAGETFSLLGGNGAETLRNLGIMEGDVELSGGNDWVMNAGTIDGDVNLGAGDDTYHGKGAGNVSGTVEGGTGNDFLRGSSADDVLNGGTDLDSVYGRGGDDHIMGGNHRDHVFGNAGDDTVDGGGGADVINGGRGDDVLIGGGGADEFVMIRVAGNDRILDFKDGIDVIDLTAFGFVPADYATVVAPALSAAGGGNTFLDLTALGGDGSVLIEGLAFASADASDFIL